MRRAVVPAVLLASSLVSSLAPSVARANGRPAATTNVFLQPGDDRSIYLAATFGLLISHDDGDHWAWVCEQAVGYGGRFDPNYRAARDGTLYATTYEGLRISRDGGCTWQVATAEPGDAGAGMLEGRWVESVDLGPADEVWVATANGGQPNDVYRSTDAGRTFTAMGRLSPVIWWKSIRVAPSDGQRIYVTGYSDVDPDTGAVAPRLHMSRSDDGGAHWQELDLSTIAVGTHPVFLLEAVSPTNPDILYGRSLGAVRPDGDKLYRSADGGVTWTAVFDSPAPIATVVIRSAPAVAGHVLLGTITAGVFLSEDGVTFGPAPISPQMACAAERGDGQLFACGDNFDPDWFALGRSTDAASWTKVFRYVEIDGPLSCPKGTIQYDTCEAKLWPTQAESFGIDLTPDADAGTPPVGPPDAAIVPPGPTPAGCCDGGAGGAGPLALGLGVGLLLLPIARRRRARPTP